MTDEAPNSEEQTGRRGISSRMGRLTLLSVGPLGLAIAFGVYVAVNASTVTTENAYIKADKIAVSAEVSGHIAEVAVRENQLVEIGQVLFRIDGERFRLNMEQSRAALVTAHQDVQALHALYRQKSAELNSVREEIAYYDSEYERAERLKTGGHISHSKYDATRRDRSMAQHRIDAVTQDMQAALASLGGDPDLPIDKHPKVLAAQNALERAKLDHARTTVVAQTRGIVSNIELQVGEYVELGEPVFSLIDVNRFWVEANFKETDLTDLREGQPAEIRVDAYPDYVWKARVASIAPATGAEFALLPPQNASGNWVKVVQRVPVRLQIERSPDEPPLRAGMSVRAKIDTGAEPEEAKPLESALSTATAQPL